MERSSSSHGSGGDGVDEEQQPLRALETARPPAVGRAAEHEARRGRLRRASVRAAIVVCLLTLIPAVLVLQRWQSSPSPDWVFEAEPPVEDDEQVVMAFAFPTRQWASS